MTDGIYCLANDGVIDGLIALCESLRRHSPDLPVTVIPYDASLTRTRQVVADYGYALMDDPTLTEMDAFGDRYSPAAGAPVHIMRKFCAFWGPYERFMFLDADIVTLSDMRQYFDAFGTHDFMYFATDIENVYRPGPVRADMVSLGTVGFNSGVFMGRSGLLTPERLEELRLQAEPLRYGFVDILDQTFANYVVDVSDWSKVSAHAVVPAVADAAALMRLRRSNGRFVLDDPRVSVTGRPVTLIHWSGYSMGPFMPYRSIFLDYRLPNAGALARLRYSAADAATFLRRTLRRDGLASLASRVGARTRNILASRGLIRWG